MEKIGQENSKTGQENSKTGQENSKTGQHKMAKTKKRDDLRIFMIILSEREFIEFRN